MSNSDSESLAASIFPRAFERSDAASVIFFRIIFGLLMATWAWDYLSTGRVTELYVKPEFHFGYYGFDWVQAWPGSGMYFHFLAMSGLALCVALGFQYRIAAFLLAVLFTYQFLIERTNYQNHYYLIGLFCWWMPFLPLNRDASMDALIRPSMRDSTVPSWVLWVLLFHVSVPYFYGGIAKLTTDWLLGQPMGIMLSGQADFPVLGSTISGPSMGVVFSYLGLLFDLAIVPLLLWKPTRSLAFLAAVAFHLSNSVLFSIHVFPWFMIAASTLYFDPSWPRRLLSGAGLEKPKSSTEMFDSAKSETAPGSISLRRKVAAGFFAVYVGFHLLWPLRHNFYEGEASWNERGHFFAWRMMLRGKEVGLGYALRDPASGRVTNVNHRQFIAQEQSIKFPRDPEMILHMAHHIADKFEETTGRRPEVYALAMTSLNGRKPQLMIDPNVDLAAEPRGIYYTRDWVPPLAEPLRKEPWDLPVEQWMPYLDLPEIKFMKWMEQQSQVAKENASSEQARSDSKPGS